MKKIIIGILLVLLLFFVGCKKKTYIISFDNNSYGFEYSSELTVNKNEEIQLPQLVDIYNNDVIIEETQNYLSVKKNNNVYVFLGWLDENGNIVSNTIKVTQDIHLKPQIHVSSSYKELRLYLNNGTIDKDELRLINFSYINLPNPIKTNCNFQGWVDEYNKTVDLQNVRINDNSYVDIYAKFVFDIEYVIQRIDTIPDEITLKDIDLVNEIKEEYSTLTPSNRLKVTNSSKLEAANKQVATLKDAKEVSDAIDALINKQEIVAADIYTADKIKEKYNKLSITNKGYLENYTEFEELYQQIEELYAAALVSAKPFNNEIMGIQIGTEFENKQLIFNLMERYDNLDANTKSLVYAEKLDYLLKKLDENADHVKYVFSNGLNQGIYTSREELFEAFFTDFYFFISINYPYYNNLIDNKLYTLEDFLNVAGDYYYGRGEMRAIGDIAGDYLLKKDVNGVIENQPENYFMGFCYKNNLYTDFLPFIYLFFAYWRLDEKYANENNYGADLFAEAWAPTVDIAKFFHFTDETSYVQTPRMIDMFQRCACVVNGFENINSKISLRGYIFNGWYDNPECTGSPITSVSNNSVLYAKWTLNAEFKETQEARIVEMYIYNLTTTKATVNETTVSYAKNMFDSLSDNAKSQVDPNRQKQLSDLVNKYL